ncbi:probable disease resistance protein At4g27220 [Gossypium arboreum]|uniref:probable disease resistance protein At4g27220 n=1 Tax=Gossypium arboreum TaxID=29729 RepID=UPI0008197883|nr:probable disease resistance protein At4g27220 [Gossypium arboreum]
MDTMCTGAAHEVATAAAKGNLENIKTEVQEWRHKVDEGFTEEAKKVNDLEVKAKTKCSRYQLSKKAEEDAANFKKLIEDARFERVGCPYVAEPIIHTDFETFQSREEVFNDIMELLKDATTSMIGVYGMAGVGKTWLVKEVERQLHGVKLFNSVVRATVSRIPDIKEIQDQIAYSLGLKLEENSPVVRVRKLYGRLRNEKNVLIIVDDLWKKLDLKEVGIPFGSQHKGCKILLTSRSRNVVSNEMGATKTFAVDNLDEEEAWEFFKKMTGNSVESDEELRSTAIEVVKKCARLPLALATVARALRNESLFGWRDALQQLQRPCLEHSSSEISAEVHSNIKLSINHLSSEDLKQIFLLCSLLRRDTRIEDLLRYARGLGLIKGVNSMKAERDRLLKMMRTLKESCLLRDSKSTNEEYFDVHDLTYSVAKSIASKDNQVLALTEVDKDEDEDVVADWPNGESMKECNEIILRDPSINKLPDQLNCPQLFLFLLFSKDLSLTLPDNFFKEAKNLKVLGLTCMHFSSLPSSIGLLTSLSTLCLDHCNLGDNLTIIGALKNLNVLSLAGSDIKIVPKEIGQLLKLKLLDVSGCTKLKTISANVLPSLSKLEELYMGGTCIQWGQPNASLAELNTLSHLSTLEVEIPDAKAAPEDFFQKLQKLERYKICIGKEWVRFRNYQYSRTLKLRLNTSIDDFDHGIKKLVKRTLDLQLDKLKGVKINALEEVTDEERLSHLQNLHIQNGLDIESIINARNEFPHLQSLTLEGLPQLVSFCCQDKIDGTSLPQRELPLFGEKVAFPSLEEMSISDLSKMKMLWRNPLPPNSFPKLQQLSVVGCDKLLTIFPSNILTTFQRLHHLTVKTCGSLEHVFEIMHEEKETALQLRVLQMNVFPASIAKDLPQLNYLAISSCGVEEIVSKLEERSDSEAVANFKFDQLCTLILSNLPGLKCFYPGKHTAKWPMLNELEVAECGEMRIFGTQLNTNNVELDSPIHPPLFLVEKVIPKLRHLTLDSDYIAMISDGEFSSSLFHEIKAFEVNYNGVESVDFQISFLERFRTLENLTISECEIKELFCTEGDTGNEEMYVGTLSTIRNLKLVALDNLKDYLWKQDVQVDHILPKLETLEVHDCCNLICLGSSSASLQNLTTLYVGNCNAMKYLDTCLAVQGMTQLKKLRVRNCISMKEIVATEEGETTCDIIFSRLKSLELVNLPRPTSFCSGNHTFGFPGLEELIVSGCPELEIFCKGVLTNPPLLQKVEYGKDNGLWCSDLNNTIQEMYSIKAGFQAIRFLVLSEFSRSIEIWKENIHEV